MNFAGCSANRQFLDSTWTQKPAKMKILFTKPTVLVGDEKINTPEPALDYFWRNNGDPEIPASMEAISDWFKVKVDNVMQFNSNVPSVVEKVSKKKISRDTENMDGVEVNIPKVESMSDSFDVYLILDEIQMKVSKVVNTMTVGPTVNPATGMPGAGSYLTFKGESTRIDANYVIYDVKTGKRLAYGHLEDDMYHEDVAAETGWYDNVRDLMLKILVQTPVTRFK
ncbi:MAG: hypothetical protein IK012_09615 [Fibrobacter sp.]|uniref:hypothetical protein n=1 Tax=Fibrobacter sp. TaxID=35828 RepID=UPI0025BEB9D8|nr:hypothetical protein [Fibrobacter sp.]MBR4785491.1 hypothetical protein [Fibrobacter sp.]